MTRAGVVRAGNDGGSTAVLYVLAALCVPAVLCVLAALCVPGGAVCPGGAVWQCCVSRRCCVAALTHAHSGADMCRQRVFSLRMDVVLLHIRVLRAIIVQSSATLAVVHT